MSEPKRRPRRGARAAKKAERATPLAYEDRAVNPGMQGGRFAPLNDVEIEKINEAVMHVLEDVGLSQAIPSCVCLLYTSPSPRDGLLSRMPSSA